MLKKRQGWTTIEYIAGAILIGTIVASLLGILSSKLETTVEGLDFTFETELPEK